MIYNYLYLSFSNIGIMVIYVMHTFLSRSLPLSENNIFQVCPCLVVSGLLLDNMVAASSYNLELHRLSFVYQQDFFYQQVFRKI